MWPSRVVGWGGWGGNVVEGNGWGVAGGRKGRKIEGLWYSMFVLRIQAARRKGAGSGFECLDFQILL